ncbi:hypothetical protein D1953_16770 [Peribacillus asahii]|uniref:Uncharacterized protein n=1 Tax=Peribacillus asahii TaxID=228899 RepID=A0A398AZ91_9BACI|nr:hypothetical protein [Peribacillus asahii]RID82989.1 hypothetical protein D1953_16770 [Peribacillus asahii]
MENAELVISDFDGTLYEGYRSFRLLFGTIKKQLPEDVQLLFTKEYRKIVSREHVVPANFMYTQHGRLLGSQTVHVTKK